MTKLYVFIFIYNHSKFLLIQNFNSIIVCIIPVPKHSYGYQRGGGCDKKLSKLLALQRPPNYKMVTLPRSKFAPKGIFSKFSRRLPYPDLFWALYQYHIPYLTINDNFLWFSDIFDFFKNDQLSKKIEILIPKSPENPISEHFC